MPSRTLTSTAIFTLAKSVGPLALALFLAVGAWGGTFNVLYNFTGGTDGGIPLGGLIADEHGNLYGTTAYGGTYGAGVVFKLDRHGKESVLYTFTGGADGGSPQDSLLRDQDGNLYGTTAGGGSYGAGVVFKLDSSGNETVLHTFTNGADGGTPIAGLIADDAGNLYGTASTGGNGGQSCPFGPSGCGLVFQIDTSGNENVLYTFTGGADGSSPYGGLLRDEAGNLYGTTTDGGDLVDPNCITYGCGTVFKLDPSNNETVLYAFTGGADGLVPQGTLVQDASGILYGTTPAGGYEGGSCPNGSGGCGVVFELNLQEQQSVLHTFNAGTDGWQPFAGVVLDKNGNIYGTTFGGGGSLCGGDGCGIVFKLGRHEKETILHSFSGTDGAENSFGSLLIEHGSLYGTAAAGGSYGAGVIFELPQ